MPAANAVGSQKQTSLKVFAANNCSDKHQLPLPKFILGEVGQAPYKGRIRVRADRARCVPPGSSLLQRPRCRITQCGRLQRVGRHRSIENALHGAVQCLVKFLLRLVRSQILQQSPRETSDNVSLFTQPHVRFLAAVSS